MKNIFYTFSQRNILLGAIGVMAIVGAISPISATAATTLTNSDAKADPTSQGFQLVWCDGPELPTTALKNQWFQSHPGKTKYTPCDFNGAVNQIQHLINVALVLGVLLAIVAFIQAGYLYMTPIADKKGEAKELMMKVIKGIVIMICAWFVIYELLNLIGANSASTYLLGSPN